MRSWLVSARQNARLTARELSRLLHISESYYCMIERGERQVKMDLTLAAKLSTALDISLEDIVRFERLSSAAVNTEEEKEASA